MNAHVCGRRHALPCNIPPSELCDRDSARHATLGGRVRQSKSTLTSTPPTRAARPRSRSTISLPTTARQHSPPSPRPTVTARHPHMVPRYTWGARAIRRLHAVDRHLSFGRPSPGARGLGLGSRDLGFSEKRTLHACALACQGAVHGAPRLALHSRAHQAMCPREHSLPHRPLPSLADASLGSLCPPTRAPRRPRARLTAESAPLLLDDGEEDAKLHGYAARSPNPGLS